MKTLVLLSAGLDSTVNFLKAAKETDLRMALTFDYGQRAAEREISKARQLCGRFSIQHQVVSLPFFKELGGSALTEERIGVPIGKTVEIDSQAQSLITAKSVWVPNRNGVFLNIAAAYAERNGIEFIVPGFNLEEASTFPDNSVPFLAAITNSLSYSTANHVKTICFTENLVKKEIYRLGISLGLSDDMLWVCYFGGKEPCKECESCQRFLRAKREA